MLSLWWGSPGWGQLLTPARACGVSGPAPLNSLLVFRMQNDMKLPQNQRRK